MDVFCSFVPDLEKQISVLIGLQIFFNGQYKTHDYFRYFRFHNLSFRKMEIKTAGAYSCSLSIG